MLFITVMANLPIGIGNDHLYSSSARQDTYTKVHIRENRLGKLDTVSLKISNRVMLIQFDRNSPLPLGRSEDHRYRNGLFCSLSAFYPATGRMVGMVHKNLQRYCLTGSGGILTKKTNQAHELDE
ncbi:hypothetical protein A130_16440 [Vibrio genomosp. F6 str. FF-238]|uniref:Uncharacterized protein n=1 Tax=Vibrio genomosp. F6 str. FF-238 TaxID=1191298 RepID=A0A1E5D006_9VIBR|nr:hypothetical protein A130_16440 [Vibrio genomosp. F6 str. FF-238]